MEIDPAVQQRLTNANQTHLLAYWKDLNEEQRKTLLHDIGEVDFNRVNQAYETIKSELFPEAHTNQPETNGEIIDDIMEPIPDHMAGSIDESTDEQIETYRQLGLKAISQGSVCVLLLAGGQGTRLGKNEKTCPLNLSRFFCLRSSRCRLSQRHVRCRFAIEQISLSNSSRTYSSSRTTR